MLASSYGTQSSREPLPQGQSQRASVRDATWYNRCNTHTAKMYHVDDGIGTSRCGRCPLSPTDYVAIDLVPKGLQCQRNGCRQRWPPKQ